MNRWKLALVGGVLVVAALITCALLGWLDNLFAFVGTALLGGILLVSSIFDNAGKAAGFEPEPEVPHKPRRTASGPISPPQDPEKPEQRPSHPRRRGSD